MFTCVLDPIGCVGSAMSAWFASIAWYWWALGGLIIVGAVWKFAGWPGLLALAGAAGYVLGRRDSSKEDDIWPDPDTPELPKPTRKPKPVNWQDGEIPRRKTAMERWIEGDQQ